MSLLVAVRFGIRRMIRPMDVAKMTYSTSKGLANNGDTMMMACQTAIGKVGHNPLINQVLYPKDMKSVIRRYSSDGCEKNLIKPFGGIILQKFYSSAHSSSRSAGPVETENTDSSHEVTTRDKDEVVETSTIVTGLNPSLATAEPSSSSSPLLSSSSPSLSDLSSPDFHSPNPSQSAETPPASQTSDETNTNTNSADTNPSSDLKLPSREQVEKYLYMAAVIIWDTLVYIYVLSRKLFEQYILKNPTFDNYWRNFTTKIDETRKEMKK